MAKYLTKQRKILQAYLSQRVDQELSAKKVAEDLAQEGVSQSAVYRNLADLEREQSVVPCCKEGGREFYFRYLGDADCQECFHISCRVCSKTEHISPEESNFIRERIGDQLHFSVDLHSTVFYGVCRECQQNPQVQ